MQKLIDNAKQDSDPRQWDPPFCGDIDLEIQRDGRWFYLGTPIERDAIVHLFARILRRQDGDYFLVTPVEKVRIRVIDAPFVIVACTISDDQILLHDNLEHTAPLNNDNALYFDRSKTQPYVHWRGTLSASLSRPVYYELCEQALRQAPVDGQYGVHSAGHFFALEPS